MKLPSIKIGLLTAMLISTLTVGQVFAGHHDDNGSSRGNRIGNVAGLYVGVFGSDEEPVAVLLSQDGGVTTISEQEPGPAVGFAFTERESPSLGTWRRTGRKSIEMALIQYRRGDFICSSFAGGLEFENCKLIIVTQLEIVNPNELQGTSVITSLDRSSGGPAFEVTDIPVTLRKTSIDDLKAMAEDALHNRIG